MNDCCTVVNSRRGRQSAVSSKEGASTDYTEQKAVEEGSSSLTVTALVS